MRNEENRDLLLDPQINRETGTVVFTEAQFPTHNHSIVQAIKSKSRTTVIDLVFSVTWKRLQL